MLYKFNRRRKKNGGGQNGRASPGGAAADEFLARRTRIAWASVCPGCEGHRSFSLGSAPLPSLRAPLERPSRPRLVSGGSPTRHSHRLMPSPLSLVGLLAEVGVGTCVSRPQTSIARKMSEMRQTKESVLAMEHIRQSSGKIDGFISQPETLFKMAKSKNVSARISTHNDARCSALSTYRKDQVA